MTDVQSIIRSAVHASLKNDEKFAHESASGSGTPPATLTGTPVVGPSVVATSDLSHQQQSSKTRQNSQERKPEDEKTKTKKQKRASKLDANWKALQKQIPKAERPYRPPPKSSTTPTDNKTTNDLNENECKIKEASFSAFMSRAVRKGAEPTTIVALDCEMVGVGPDGHQDALARVSIVNYAGDILYDTFVKPGESVTDYRTKWSGVRECDIGPDSAAVSAFEAQRVVGDLLRGRIVVGHALKNDFRVLRIAHAWQKVRDTSEFYKKLWRYRGNRRPALRVVVAEVLGVDTFQKDEHNSCEDARAALALYKKNSKDWENMLRQGGGLLKRKVGPVGPKKK